MEYINLRPKELVKERTKNPVAYLPLGILEWHGVHNPLGLDGIKPTEIMKYISEKLGGIVMPTLYWGDNRQHIAEIEFDPKVNSYMPEDMPDYSTGICEYMQLSRKRLEAEGQRCIDNGAWRLWEELIVHNFFQIESLGFETIVAYPGHGPLSWPLERAIETYKEKGGICKTLVIQEKDFDHAGKTETSIMLRLRPELVDLNELKKGDDHLGVRGEDPLEYASYEFGEEVLQNLLKQVKKGIEK